MDGNRFDDLSRKLASGVSRRTAVKGAAAGLLGAFGLRSRGGVGAAQAQCGNKTCKNNPGKCGDGCVCCVYGNGNNRCRPAGDCSGEVLCAEGETYNPDVEQCVSGTCIHLFETCVPGVTTCCDDATSCSQHGDCYDIDLDAFCC